MGRSELPLEGTLKPGHRMSRNCQGDDEGGGRERPRLQLMSRIFLLFNFELW